MTKVQCAIWVDKPLPGNETTRRIYMYEGDVLPRIGDIIDIRSTKFQVLSVEMLCQHGKNDWIIKEGVRLHVEELPKKGDL